MRYSFYVWDGDVPTSLEHCIVIQHRIDMEQRRYPPPPPVPELKHIRVPETLGEATADEPSPE